MANTRAAIVITLGLTLACTEPNPYAQETGETGGETGEPPGCGDPACALGLETLEFSLQGDETFTAELPKPPQQESVPIAAVRRYEPGQSDALGYAIAWTDNGDSWGLEVTTTGAANNSRIAGVAVVIGLGEDFPAPEVHALEITTTDGCGTLESSALNGRFFVDTVERYDPGGNAVFEFSRNDEVGETARVEYCVSQPDDLDGTLGVKLIAFDVPDGALALAAGARLDSNGGATESFASLGEVTQLVHLLGAHELNEQAAPGLGYAANCDAQAPYACNYNLSGFSEGVSVELGGAVLATQ